MASQDTPPDGSALLTSEENEEKGSISTVPQEIVPKHKNDTELKNQAESKEDEVFQGETSVASVAGESSKECTAVSSYTPTTPTKPHEGTMKSSKRVSAGVAFGTSHYNLLRFPLRVGITWKKGERLEAMDFSRTWYPSKIVDIDEEEKFVLIHFEGWNSRYDEWVPMDSDKLRPATRHSERKEKHQKKARNLPQPIYRPGEAVLARWTDCKKYPGKICRIRPDGSFEVIFYDGVSHIVQPINIQPLPEQLKLAAENIQLPPSPPGPDGAGSHSQMKSTFKSVTLQLPESVVKRSTSDVEQASSSGLKKLPTMEKRNRHMEKSIKKSLAHISGTFKKSPLRAHRLKVLQGSSNSKAHKSSTPIQTMVPSSPPSSPISTTATTSSCGTTTTPSSGKLVMVIKKDQDFAESILTKDQDFAESILTSAGVQGGPLESSTLPTGAKRVKKRANTDSSLSPKKKRKHKLKEAGLIPKRHMISSGQRAHSLDLTGPPSAATPSPHMATVPQFFVPSKAFVVEEDHNPYKCPFQGCTKEFRKEGLLTYHIKYYHTNPETNPVMTASATTMPAGGPLSPLVTSPHTLLVSPVTSQTSLITPVLGHRRRRRKTDSFCSTDSDVSVSSKGKSSSKRHRHDSEISVTGSPDLVSRDLWADVKLKAPQDSLLEENGETEEEDVEADLVNCICQIRETNGLMIQCDVCMCWQHFTCVDTEGTGRPPANYVCLACERPTGVRDSCRYMYDMGWERRGELPTFPFLSSHGEASGEKGGRLKQVASNCNTLTSALLGIKAVLHSMKRQIKISKEEDEPEFQLWQTDWDNWTKPEEDLTLTPPHSVEAAPSPAPSTFMFPQAPSSPPPASTTAPPSTSSSGIPQSLDNVLYTSCENPTITSVSSMSSFSPLSCYQDTFKSWLSTKDPPTSSLSSPLKSETGTRLISALSNSPVLGNNQVTSHSSGTGCQSNPLTPPLGLGQRPAPPPSSSTPSQASPLTPPMSSGQALAPPQTPLSVRSSRMLSMTDRGETDLVRDLFPLGPGGDAAANVRLASSSPADRSSLGEKKESHTSPEQRLPNSSVSGILTSSTSSTLIPTATTASASATISYLSSLSSTMSSSLSSSLVTSTPSSPSPLSTLSMSGSITNITYASSTDVTCNINQAGNALQKQTVPSNSLGSGLEKNGEGSHTGYQDETLPIKKETKVSSSDQASFSSSQQPLHELFVDVNGDGDMNADDGEDDNDTDTAEESADPYRDCERNLLVHISRTHDEMESQLEDLEKQIEDLENSDLSDPTILLSRENVLNDVPALKKSLGKLVRSLDKIRHLSLYR